MHACSIRWTQAGKPHFDLGNSGTKEAKEAHAIDDAKMPFAWCLLVSLGPLHFEPSLLTTTLSASHHSPGQNQSNSKAGWLLGAIVLQTVSEVDGALAVLRDIEQSSVNLLSVLWILLVQLVQVSQPALFFRLSQLPHFPVLLAVDTPEDEVGDDCQECAAEK